MLSNHVANDISRFQIKLLKHKHYLYMNNGWALKNVVNRRIGSKIIQGLISFVSNLTSIWVTCLFHCSQVYTMKQK